MMGIVLADTKWKQLLWGGGGGGGQGEGGEENERD